MTPQQRIEAEAKKSNELRDEIINILEQNLGMRALYPLLHMVESELKQLRADKISERNKTLDEAMSIFSALSSVTITIKEVIDELEALKIK